MTPEQMNTLLSTFFSGIASAGGYLIAIFTIWYQGRREAQKAKLDRTWAVEDRNISRKWNVTDKRIEIRKEQLLIHQQYIEEYLKSVLEFYTQTHLVPRNEDTLRSDQLNKTRLDLISHVGEMYHHLEAFGDNGLIPQFEDIVGAFSDTGKFDASKEDMSPARLVYRLSSYTASIARRMEFTIAKDLVRDDYL